MTSGNGGKHSDRPPAGPGNEKAPEPRRPAPADPVRGRVLRETPDPPAVRLHAQELEGSVDAAPTSPEHAPLRPPPSPRGGDEGPTAKDVKLAPSLRPRRPRRARAVEAEADLWAALDTGPPSIPSAAQPAPQPAAPPRAPSGAPVASVVEVGQTLALRYRVESVLGEGGMGIVYRCFDRYTSDRVALKRVIIPEGPLAHEYVMWFYKESRALATLDHPCIVRARDFGQLENDSPFLVMDLVSGVSLHELSHTKLSFPLLWSIVDQILAALAHAHARGIIHGDLKPSNILVEEVEAAPPRVHVLDFGLAWLKQDRHDERLDGTKSLEFAPHAGAGTPGYMAPEQIQHESAHVCGATDLYSLGCILYRMLSGKAPFSGEPKELLRHHAFDPPPVPRLQLEAPSDAIHFLMRLLAKQPWDRWEFASEARVEWQRFKGFIQPTAAHWVFPELAHRRGHSAPPPPPAPRHRPESSSAHPASADPGPGLLRIRQSPLVGNHEVRTQLKNVCSEVIAGRGPTHRLVLLVGAAGVGKSRIAEWLCERVHEEGSFVPLRARYRSIGGTLDGLVGAVTQYFNFERADRDTIERSLLARWKIGRHDKPGRTWVAGVAEWLRPLGPISDQPIGPSGIRFTLDTTETRHHVIRFALRRIARGRPLLLWLDDLHQAPEPTITGLSRLLTEEPDQRILVVGTARTEESLLGSRVLERLEPLREAIATDLLEIRPMDPETTVELLRAALPLDQPAAEEAARRSRGNPLFALQQLHAWALAGDLIHEDGLYRVPAPVLALRPKTTAELWDSRVQSLPTEHRLAAYAAASLGSDIRRVVLHALLTALELPADAALLSLQNAEILAPRGPGRYSWPHALLLEHLTERLSERDDAHRIYRSAAQALTHHPLAATRRVVRQRVVNLIGASDPDAAAALLFEFLETSAGATREPLTLLGDLELLRSKLGGHALAQKHRWQAEALRQVAKAEEAAMHAEVARAAFEQLQDQANLAHSLRLLGQISFERGNAEEGLTLVEQARRLFEQLNSVAGLAQCESVAAEIAYALGNTEAARTDVERAQSHFAALGQPLGRGRCLLLLGSIEQTQSGVDRARRRFVEARTEFERAGHRLGIAEADLALARIEHQLFNFHSAARGAEEALAVFETLSTPRNQLACLRLLCLVAIDTDELATAQRHSGSAHHLALSLEDPLGRAETTLLAAQVALLERDHEQAARHLTEAEALVKTSPEVRQHALLTRAWWFAGQSDATRALDAILSARQLYLDRRRSSDHAIHLLMRLGHFPFDARGFGLISDYRRQLLTRSHH